MSSIQIDALSMALKDCVLERKLTKEESLYMHDSVVKANKIVQAVGAEGIDLKQTAQRTKVSTTELKPLLKWLESKRLIKAQKNGAVHLYSRA